MANIYVTGPAYLYVSFPANVMQSSGNGLPAAFSYPSAKYFLGTAEQPPTIGHNPLYSPVMNDIGGNQHPVDKVYQGQTETVTATLSMWNEYVLNVLDRIADWVGGNPRGYHDDMDYLLMSMEGQTFHLWVHFPYYSKFSGFYMPNGYHGMAVTMNPYQITPGTGHKRRLVSFECNRVYNPVTGSTSCFDNTMTGIPPMPIAAYISNATTGLVTATS